MGPMRGGGVGGGERGEGGEGGEGRGGEGHVEMLLACYSIHIHFDIALTLCFKTLGFGCKKGTSITGTRGHLKL